MPAPCCVEGRATIARQGLRDAATCLLLTTVLAGAALALAWPWLPGRPDGPALARYAPLRDGDATLAVTYDMDGQITSWESANRVVMGSLRAVAEDLPQPAGQAILRFAGWGGRAAAAEPALIARLGEMRIVETRLRSLSAMGEVTTSSLTSVREARGELLVGRSLPAENGDVVFEPPVLLLPSDLEPGRSWDGSGTTGDGDAYQLRGEVAAGGPYEGPLGTFADCLRVVTRLALSRQGQAVSETEHADWYCSDVGLVESERRVDGATVARSLTLATGRHAVATALPPLALTDTPRIDETEPGAWSLTRVGRTRSSSSLLISTLPPTWIPTDPPLLVSASYESDLVAFAAAPAGAIRWRFHVDGSVFGPPAFDAARGQLYFGASDKRLRAVDARGLYRWAFEAGDSIASRPTVFGDLVIFGSEDRSIYAVDAATGTLRWSRAVGDAVVSSPAVVEAATEAAARSPEQAVLVIGSDDGKVYGLDPMTGDERWTYATGGPVEAPVSTADGVIYVASRSGIVAALDPATGRPFWTSQIAPDTATLNGSRSALALSALHLFAVDENRYVTALSRADGRRIWSSGDAIYVGSPVVLGDTVIATTRDGAIHQLDARGVRQTGWSIKSLRDSNGGGAEPSFDFGPVLGGGALWLADDQGTVYRLGPAFGPASARQSRAPRQVGVRSGRLGAPSGGLGVP